MLSRSRSPSAARRFAGQDLLHPVALVALLVLVGNDHFAKWAYPGWLTGKLSDVAGLALFPLILMAAYEWWRGPAVFLGRAHRHVVVAAIGLTAVAFTLVKTLPAATHGYRLVWAALQWPASAAWSLLTAAALPRLRPVALTRDVTDLVALPALAVPAWIARRRPQPAAPIRSLGVGQDIH
jgi:hypothetical protein